jgi:uncharacterized RDD family membrane protein YckC
MLDSTPPSLVKPACRLFLRRCAAYLADILLLFAVLFPLGWVVARVVDLPPASLVQVWPATLFNFSIPSWLYFTLSDSLWGGQTVGKRLLRLKVTVPPGYALSVRRALLRTAVKLLPWELAHAGGFALAEFPVLQWAFLGLSNLLIVVYLSVALATRGRRSMHDFIARTEVSCDFDRRS